MRKREMIILMIAISLLLYSIFISYLYAKDKASIEVSKVLSVKLIELIIETQALNNRADSTLNYLQSIQVYNLDVERKILDTLNNTGNIAAMQERYYK